MILKKICSISILHGETFNKSKIALFVREMDVNYGSLKQKDERRDNVEVEVFAFQITNSGLIHSTI